MTENQQNFAKGSLQKALNGEFDFDVKNTLKEGWEITLKDKFSMLLGMLVVFFIAILVMAFAQVWSDMNSLDFNDPTFNLWRQIILMVLVSPFLAGMMMMGINASIGGKNELTNVFRFLHRTMSIIVTSLMVMAIVQLGMFLFLLPGLYLMVATGFAIPLMLDKGALPTRAIFMSIRVVNFQLFKFLKLYAVFFLLMLLVIVTLGLAIIWVAPFYYNVKGLLYRDIFGVGTEHQVLFPEGYNKGAEQGEMDTDTDSRSLNKTDKKEDYFDA